MPEPEQLYAIDRVAALWDVCPKTVRNLIRRRQLRHVRVGTRVAVPESALREYLEANTVPVSRRRRGTLALVDPNTAA